MRLSGKKEYISNNGPLPSAPTFSQTFGYDGVNRLTNASEAGGWSQSYGYDQYGNMWMPSNGLANTNQSVPGSDVYNGNNQNPNFSYDAAGNQTAFGSLTLTYDAENRQSKMVDMGGGTGTFQYDGLGHRVVKVLPSLTTTYVYDGFGQIAAEYYSGTALPRPPCSTCYLSYDYLGSVRMVTDAGANVVARHDFAPFGQEIGSGVNGRGAAWGLTSDADAKFTGQVRDQESGLDFFNARYFAATLGRFNSPDPGNAGASLGSSQSWNGYGYVLANPLGLVDPSGACDVVIGGITQTPNTSGTAAQQNFANSIGAISVFPYARGSIAQGVAAVASQGANNVTSETTAVISALTAAAADGNPINVFAFSGGAQAFSTALRNLPSNVASLIHNITYVSPGAQDPAVSPTGGSLALVRSTGLLDMLIIGSVPPLISSSNIFTVGCGFGGHDASCEFPSASLFMQQFAGTPCRTTTGTFANYQSNPPTRGVATSTITYGDGGFPVVIYGEEGNPIGVFGGVGAPKPQPARPF